MALREPGAGELSRRVRVRRRSDLPADSIGLDSVFSESKWRWAMIVPAGTGVYVDGIQTDNKFTHWITLRFLKGVTSDHEVVHGSTLYRVKRSADMNGSHRFTLLQVEELGEAQAGGNIYV